MSPIATSLPHIIVLMTVDTIAASLPIKANRIVGGTTAANRAISRPTINMVKVSVVVHIHSTPGRGRVLPLLSSWASVSCYSSSVIFGTKKARKEKVEIPFRGRSLLNSPRKNTMNLPERKVLFKHISTTGEK